MKILPYYRIGEDYKIPDTISKREQCSFNDHVDLKYIGSLQRDNDVTSLTHFFLDRNNWIYFCPDLKLKLPKSILEFKMCYRIYYYRLEFILDKLIYRDIIHMMFKEIYHVKDLEISHYIEIGKGT